MTRERAKDWLAEARDDEEFARYALAGGFFAKACFVSQQAAEKALKAMLFHRQASAIFTRSLKKMLDALSLNGDLQHAARVLDLYYVGARYPHMLTEGHPSAAFDRLQAEEAIVYARKFLAAAEAEMLA